MDADGDMSIAKYEIPEGKPYKPNPKVTSVKKITEMIKQVPSVQSK